MAILGITYQNQGPTAADHGVLFGALLADGIVEGAAITYVGATLTIAPGYIVSAGRLARFAAAETVTLDATSGVARVILETDLAAASTAESFEQLSVVVQTAPSISALPSLVQEDINTGGTLYQAELATVALSSTGITAILSSMPRAGIWATTAALPAAGWAELQQTVAVPGIGPDSLVVVSPAPASFDVWTARIVRAVAQGSGTLTFQASTPPTEEMTANVLIVR